MATEYRNELKYICTEQQLRMIENNIMGVCQKDIHTAADGKYMIRSLYFDDLWDGCLRDNEMGTEPRAKYRIRVYDGSLERISLECKSKHFGMTKKEMRVITEEDALRMISGDYCYFGEDPFLRKFFLKYRSKMLRPRVIVEYVRTPYIYPYGNVRITFDRDIHAATNFETYWQEDEWKMSVLPEGTHILEIKYDEFLPDFLKNMIQTEGLQQTSFSKYYHCRRREDGNKIWLN